ncbi:hypothetical protein [Blautia sp.]|nr:hypothetical protein [Blautia sp.]
MGTKDIVITNWLSDKVQSYVMSVRNMLYDSVDYTDQGNQQIT